MELVVAFFPWIVFGLLSHHSPRSALLLALAASMVQVILHVRRPKLLEWISLSFFLFAGIALFVLHWDAFARHMGLIVHLILASVAWGSLAAGQPFTLAYARESVPPERWSDAAFIRTNQLITAFWGTDFLLQAAILEYQAAYGGVLPSVASTVCTILTLAFTFGYPRYVRRHERLDTQAAGHNV